MSYPHTNTPRWSHLTAGQQLASHAMKMRRIDAFLYESSAVRRALQDTPRLVTKQTHAIKIVNKASLPASRPTAAAAVAPCESCHFCTARHLIIVPLIIVKTPYSAQRLAVDDDDRVCCTNQNHFSWFSDSLQGSGYADLFVAWILAHAHSLPNQFRFDAGKGTHDHATHCTQLSLRTFVPKRATVMHSRRTWIWLTLYGFLSCTPTTYDRHSIGNTLRYTS